MRYDLHTHSNCSDGSLPPAELRALAGDCGVDVLAITDHDTVAAYSALGDAAAAPIVVTGIEFSTTWQGRSIHVVGLNLDLENDALQDGVAKQRAARRKRAETIGRRLEKLGIEDACAAAMRRARGTPGRPHFAQHLVDIGVVKDVKTAFRRYLGAGKAGDVRQHWASMHDVVAWIRGAGGDAVLAHPGKYRLTRSKLLALVDAFRAVHGNAIEVSCGMQDPEVTNKLARLANETGLLASCGSDFHHPGLPWSRPGHFQALPGNVVPVWDHW